MQKLAPHFLHCLVLGFGLLVSPLFAQQPEAKPGTAASPDANAWSVKVYRYPSEALTSGFVSRERGQLSAPPMPAANASAEEIATFLKRSNDAVTQHLKYESVLMPKGSFAAFDPGNQTLVVRTTNAVHGRIESMVENATMQLPKYLSFSIRILEADGKVVREVVKECSTKADHRAALARLQGLVAQGQAKHLGMLRVDTRSGQRASVTNATEFHYLTGQTVDEKGQAETTQETRKVGTLFEVDPVIAPDGRLIDVNFSLEHHHTPPTMRWVVSGQRGTKAIESPTPDFHIAKVTTAVTLQSGMTKLVEIWKPQDPAGAPPTDRLQMAFLKGDVVSLLPALDGRIENLLRTHGEKIEPTPQAPAAETGDLPPGMVLRSFRIPPTFLSAAGGAAAPAAPAEPFAPAAAMPSEPRLTVHITALEILRAQGIPFPPGSSANFTPSTGELLVRNTPENMAMIEEYVKALVATNPRVVVTTIHIVQADGATLRKLESDTASIADHTAIWSRMENEVAAGRAKMVRSAWLESRSGQRATFEGITEHIYPTGTNVSKPSRDEKASTVNQLTVLGGGSSPLSSEWEMQPVGLRFELDPVIGPDGSTTDLNLGLDYDFAPPTLQREPMVSDEKVFRFNPPGLEFHRTNITTAVTLQAGLPRLLGIWKPTGAPEFENGDIMQAAFLRVDIVEVQFEGEK